MINMKAIQYLRPDAEFVMTDDDPSTIVWHTEGVTTPTAKQIKDAIKAMETEDATFIATKAAAKASAIAKLEALGLNLDEAQAIIGQ
jgi:glucuronate isomerase